MNKQNNYDFDYYVGVDNLADVATKEDRVCVLNILGAESRGVTPISHEFSGGNIVFGTAAGKSGQSMETKAGDIPVYGSVKQGIDAGHKFNVGVVYLPPSAVRNGVAELIDENSDLTKIIILTEKVPVSAGREIRAMAQAAKVDVFGANCLGVADAWNNVRIGGALGGNNPEESLKKGSVAVFSNSGNFTTTIANYLAIGGWGTTTSISSGKDVYIHFAAKEFARALSNDDRSKAAVMYIEPGGYYEHGLELDKPTVTCVVGRWKAKLTRAVGHAGAIAGSGDDALAKEGWFKDIFGVEDIYTPENPVCSSSGAVVTNISHIPEALGKVMELNGQKPDFPSEGDLSLKPWFANTQGLDLPAELDVPVIEAIQPYNAQIAALNSQVGAIFPRQSMKDTSGATQMDAKTQVTSVHGVSVLEQSQHSIESNIGLALFREFNDENDDKLINSAMACGTIMYGDPIIEAAQLSRDSGNSPNTVMSAVCCLLGSWRVEQSAVVTERLIDLFGGSGLADGADEDFSYSISTEEEDDFSAFVSEDGNSDARAEALLEAIQARGAKSFFVKFLMSLGIKLSADAVLAAVVLTVAWDALMRKRISIQTAINASWHLRILAAMISASASYYEHEEETFCGVHYEDMLNEMTATEIAYLALTGEKPTAETIIPFQVLIGLLTSNGPGTISAQGAKGAVAADGPQVPERVQINKAYNGFLTHTGFSHGGNGYEGMSFLIDIFSSTDLEDAGDKNHGLDLKAMAEKFAVMYGEDKKARKAAGEATLAIPGINHPVFKGQPVNYDPREVFVSEFFEKRGEYNVFHDFYKHLVQALFDKKVTKNVFCVNIDAVIAAVLLKIFWSKYKENGILENTLENAAFTAFLFGRMIGTAAEIEDHINRGRNMDVRTKASFCKFVS
ncbi:MAG: CoA-binding protein [Alphaproteobacteria bacterium]|nr:CoA-binding protein [Alphaproteobacteria bacterium]